MDTAAGGGRSGYCAAGVAGVELRRGTGHAASPLADPAGQGAAFKARVEVGDEVGVGSIDVEDRRGVAGLYLEGDGGAGIALDNGAGRGAGGVEVDVTGTSLDGSI